MKFVKAAINGSRTGAEHGGVPITPQELGSMVRSSSTMIQVQWGGEQSVTVTSTPATTVPRLSWTVMVQ